MCAVVLTRSRGRSQSAAISEMRPVDLSQASTSRFSIWMWILKSYSQRSGRGYAGVLAEFKLSKQSCVWTSLCVNRAECVFVGIGETKTELQYLFSWSLHLLSCFFELEFEDKTRCAFEGSWSLCIYVKCACALTFPHYGGIHYARIMCPPFS